MSSEQALSAPGIADAGGRPGGFPAAWLAGLPVGRLLLRAAALLACVAFWQAASVLKFDFGLVTFRYVPAPSDVIVAGWNLFQSPKLASHVVNSLIRVFSGFAAATLLGIVVGVLIGRSRRFEDTLLPPLEVLRPIPGVAWIPLAILMFPSSELSMVFITFMGAFFPILLNTVHGVEAVDRRLIASSRSLGAGRWSVLAEVVVPGALPSIVTGLAIGMGTSWFCLVTAEMIAGQYGIGYYTWESYTLQNYPDIVVGMLFIGAFGMASSGLIKLLGRVLMPWYRIQERHS
ncbi:ABC transporter permease [Azonexus sp. R2A61]|uniref:ABC transporter permease n=1 Tax=Azonexus sp. R2A61 TaxID=2744443 RepID=UPI001F2B86BB|nr:ABC transporter permease [Azonexus sp. R2A61]